MFNTLTPREREVVACVADAMDNKTAAAHLGISHETVKQHLVHIFKKLGVNSRLELAVSVHKSTPESGNVT